MKDSNRKIKRWLIGVLTVVSLTIMLIMTFKKANEVRKNVRDRVLYYDVNNQNTSPSYGLTDFWYRETIFFVPELEYQNDTGLWIELVDGNGQKVDLPDYILELGTPIENSELGEILTVVAPLPDETVLRQKWTYIDPESGNEKTYSVEDLLNYHITARESSTLYRRNGTSMETMYRAVSTLPIMVTGKRDGIVVTIRELSIDVGQIIESAGGDGASVEPLRIVFPEGSEANGVDYIYKDPFFRVYNSEFEKSESADLNHLPDYSLENVSELKDGEAITRYIGTKACEEAREKLREKPFLKPEEGDYQFEEGWFTYVVRCNLVDDDYSADLDSQGCVLSAVYLTHPIRIAMKLLVRTYLLIFAAAGGLYLFYDSMSKRLQKIHDKYDRARLAMTRYAAHELKTPLAVTRSYAVSLAEGLGDPETREQRAKDMVKQVDTVTALIEDLLELSRLESDARTPVPENIDLTSLTNALLKQIEPIAQYRRVTVNAPEGESLISADLSMTRTVLMNFLTNAVRYSRNYINVAITREKNRIRWSVSNDGTTIPEADLDRVWDAFFTVDESRSKAKGGTGLGLAITKQILDLHKAKYGCTSDDKETTFFFEMPETVETEEETAE